MTVDVLAIGAHPDDVEMTIGGTLAKLIDRGRRIAIVDMTRGEIGSNGTPEQRAEEAAAAAETLGVHDRINLDLGDGVLANTLDNRKRVIEVIRDLRPTLVFCPYWEDLHPDHRATGEIVRDVMYPAGFVNFPAQGKAYRPNEFLFYMSHFPFAPTCVIDITEHHERKMDAVRCYASQLHNHAMDRVPTQIGQPDFLHRLEARARHYGGLIGRRFGEPVWAPRPVPIDDPVTAWQPFTKI